jgi:Protein of unknown function (DUF4238)
MTAVTHAKRQKHHYIPEFYLKQWTKPNHKGEMKLFEFRRRYRGKVTARPTSPGGTGYEENLYTLSGFPPETAQQLEDGFFKEADQRANDALLSLLSYDTNMSMDMRSGWSRFILSLLHRNPEKIEWAKDEVRRNFDALNGITQREREIYLRHRSPSDPPTFEGYLTVKRDEMNDTAFASLMQTIVDSKVVGTYLNGMTWGVRTFSRPSHSLLTSDRPVVMTDGIKLDHSYILVPISPNTIFLAANNEHRRDILFGLSQEEIFTLINNVVCKQAQKFVYGVDERQLRFIENRLGRGTPQFIAGKPLWPEAMNL